MNAAAAGAFWRLMKGTHPKLEWPRWATGALALTVVTCVITIAATINDIW